MPGLGVRFVFAFDRTGQGNAHAGQQHGLGAQQAFEFGDAVIRAFKIFAVRPNAHFGAAVFDGAFAHFRQRFDHVAAGKHDAVDFAFAFDGDLKAGGEGVGDGYAHAVQAA